MKTELGLPNYAGTADLKNWKAIDTLDFATKTELANLKSSLDKLDIDKFKNVPSNSSNSKSKVDWLDIRNYNLLIWFK